MQCGCNLRRVVLPFAFPSEQLRRRPTACSREMGDLFNTLNQGSPTILKLRATSCVPINAKGYYCSLIHTSEIKVLLILLSIILVLIFVNVKTLIMPILFLEQAHGRPTWSLRATWCPRAPRW